ncbi:MAG TPA: hypothetical protein VGG72_24855 [Bryobacteraceae bacterium]|jgi:hypothetical protein
MPVWCEDVETFSLDEVFQQVVENRMWSKELRRRNNSLVNSRLAKEITQDDYLAERKLAHADAEECKRRATILDAQLILRTGRPLISAPL